MKLFPEEASVQTRWLVVVSAAADGLLARSVAQAQGLGFAASYAAYILGSISAFALLLFILHQMSRKA